MKILSLLNCSDVEMDCRTLTSQLGEVSLVCGLTMIWFLVFIFLLVTCWSLNISLSPYILTVWIHMSQVLVVDCWSRSFNFLSSSSSYHYTKKYIYIIIQSSALVSLYISLTFLLTSFLSLLPENLRLKRSKFDLVNYKCNMCPHWDH